MESELLGRSAEAKFVAAFMDSFGTDPAAVLLEGPAGIGKSTLLLAAVDQARQRGIRVLLSRTAAAESVLAYASLADLLGGVDQALIDSLPEPQRRAVDRVLLRSDDGDAATDPRAIAAAMLTVVNRLAENSPVLLAVDDLQWLDRSSANVMAFVVRRLVGPVGFAGTVRTGPGEDPVSWVQLTGPEDLRRITVQPLSIGPLHAVVAQGSGRALSRPALVRIHEVSGGNPFYALELARHFTTDNVRSSALPPTLAELVQSRIMELSADVGETLLAVAALAIPTIDVVAKAIGVAPDELVGRLAEAEDHGVITVDGNQVRFSHPLLAHGVYSAATPAGRRATHRRLAAIVDQPELRARHLALAATHGDDVTLQALAEAAEAARHRGAPAAAAEFVELAIGLGGDTPERRILLGTLYFSAGDPDRARKALGAAITAGTPANLRAQALCMLGVWAVIDGSSRDAVEMYERALADVGDDQGLRAQIAALLSFAQLHVGEVDSAAWWAEEVLTRAASLEDSAVLSIALSMAVFVRFLLGHGFDETAMNRALKSEDRDVPVTALLSPTVQRAQLLVGAGRLDEAQPKMKAVHQYYLDRGEEGELMVIAFYDGLSAIWQSRFGEAAAVTDEAMQRALELDRDLPRAVALLLRAAIASYRGHEQKARDDAQAALALAAQCEANFVAVWPRTTLGFLEISLGNYAAALDVLQPLVAMATAMPMSTEIFVTPFLPDAAEALIQLGRAGEAEPLVDALETNGLRLDRPWMLACGGRCRALLLACRGDLGGATTAAQRALVEHDRLPMPFERARTQLVLGQLQRRQRHREQAAATIGTALAAFEAVGTPLWAERARVELERVNVRAARADALTDAELRIAELVASGKTNREVAAALFVSAKTVEVHLSRIYRKLGIRSRSELGWHIVRPPA